MKKDKKTDTFLYEDLGFPIKLVNFPLKKILGEWVLDINLGKFQRDVLNVLVYKNHPLTGPEVRFIRKYFEMTTTNFGKDFGVSHAAVLKWESGQNRIPPTTDFYIRMYILNKLHAKNEDYGKLFHKIPIVCLAEHRNELDRVEPLEFDANRQLAYG